MKIRTIILLCTAAVAMLWACGSKTPDNAQETDAENNTVSAEGDMTIYGLACDGTNDTIIIYLPTPYDGSDPDTLNILEATRRHRIFGQPRIGYALAIVKDAQDSTVADMVIATDALYGQWCFQVYPTLRHRADMEDTRPQHQPDSIREMLATPAEYMVDFKENHLMHTRSTIQRELTSDEEAPVEYPAMKRYSEWALYNGHLLLTETAVDSLGNTYVASIDTVDFKELTTDTLVLRFNDGTRGYYRPKEQ